MFKILEKNLKPFIINLILTAAVVTVLKFLTGPGVSVVLVIIGGPLILFAVVGAIFINEQYEEKQGAYELLGMLPVRPSEIIGAKFIPVVGTAFLLTGYLMMILG